ncbi:MAG: class I SAM-dependent methyltransferase [Methylophilaceae bacterium]
MVDIDNRINNEKKFHNKRYSNDERTNKYNKFYEFNTKLEEYYFKECLFYSKNKITLEIGCGTGTSLGYQVNKVTTKFNAIDISEVGVQKAREFYNNKNVNVLDIHKTTFPTSHFDFIFCTATLHHLDIKNAFKEIMRILKPGGTFIMIEPLGINPLINFYRILTPNDRSLDEKPLDNKDLKFLINNSKKCEIHYHNILLFFLPLLRINSENSIAALFFKIDKFFCKIPLLRKLAWYCMIKVYK